MAADDRPFEAGQRVGRYLILKEIGRGAMGAVHLARDTVLRREVALKVLPRGAQRQRGVRERFVREAQAAAKIHHRNVVAVHDVHVDDPPFIVLEHLRGETLDAYLKREGPLSLERALDLLLPVMSAVAAAHDAGVVHRDLKPSNIMLVTERDGALTPKVLDFGISKLASVTAEFRLVPHAESDLTSNDQLLGTPSYMPPEQHGAQDAVGPWSDVYALALIVYLAVTGQRAFKGNAMHQVFAAKVNAAFAPPSSFPFGLSKGLDAWMRRAVAPDPADRFRRMHDAARALLDVAGEAQRARWLPVFEASDEVLEVSSVLDATRPTPNDLTVRDAPSESIPVELTANEAASTEARASVEIAAPRLPARSRLSLSVLALALTLGVALGLTVRELGARAPRAETSPQVAALRAVPVSPSAHVAQPAAAPLAPPSAPVARPAVTAPAARPVEVARARVTARPTAVARGRQACTAGGCLRLPNLPPRSAEPH